MLRIEGKIDRNEGLGHNVNVLIINTVDSKTF